MKNKYKSNANIVASRLTNRAANADELKYTSLCAIRSENHDVVRKRGGRKAKSNLARSSLATAVQGALFFLGSAVYSLPAARLRLREGRCNAQGYLVNPHEIVRRTRREALAS